MLSIDGPRMWATFSGKLNRFTAIVECEGEIVHAHLPTSSRMREMLYPGVQVLLVDRARPGRATGYDLIMARMGEELVSVDSRVPNRLLEVVLRDGSLPEFAGWQFERREAPLGESRLDFLLHRGGQRCWVEAKSVTLVENGIALFPDAPTLRGARHLRELSTARARGDRAVAVFVIQRGDALCFSPNRVLDQNFADALAIAMTRGVEVFAYRCRMTPGQIAIDRLIECEFETQR